MPAGYIYVMSNPAFSFVKIGKTTRHPEERAAELSRSTGVPHPFAVEHAVQVQDIDGFESAIHRLLATQKRNKEFFDISVDEAKRIIQGVADLLGEGLANPPCTKEPIHSEFSAKPLNSAPDASLSNESAQRLYDAERLRKVEAARKREAQWKESKYLPGFAARKVETVCRKCSQPFSVTLRRYEDAVACPACFHYNTVSVAW